MFACAEPCPPQWRVCARTMPSVRATSFWEFPIRTLYREFPESRALRSPQSPRRHAVARRLGSGSQLQEFAGATPDFEAPIVVLDPSSMRGGCDRHVPQELDRPLLPSLED